MLDPQKEPIVPQFLDTFSQGDVGFVRFGDGLGVKPFERFRLWFQAVPLWNLKVFRQSSPDLTKKATSKNAPSKIAPSALKITI